MVISVDSDSVMVQDWYEESPAFIVSLVDIARPEGRDMRGKKKKVE
jgi:hypothetical protein